MPSVNDMLDRMQAYDLTLTRHQFKHIGEGTKPWSRRFSNGVYSIDVRASDWTAYDADNKELKSGRDPSTLVPYLDLMLQAAACSKPQTANQSIHTGEQMSDEKHNVTYEITVKIKVAITDPAHPGEDPNLIAQKYADMAKQYRSIGAYDAQVLEVKKVE